jgi:eukaryotic-like serine/threonine-protein kinase
MGTVWQAHDEVLGRDVAVKEVILPFGLSDEERSIQYKRTFREARTAARLGHPGVVTVYDVVEEDGRPWIIMELVRSRSLDQVIKQEGPLSPGRAAEIGRQMLAALHAAHEAGVLHRDVKPSNVLLGAGERAVLTDFGIATATGDVTLTQTGLVMGSPAYIAPERARGRTIGPASDLWSLGISLYAMVDGRTPYERSEPMASLVAVISEDPEPPVNAGPLGPVIDGLLRKDPDQRMTAREAGALLDEIVRADARADQRTRALELPTEELLAAKPDEPAAPTVRDESPAAAAGGAQPVAPAAGSAAEPAAEPAGDGSVDPAVEPAKDLETQPVVESVTEPATTPEAERATDLLAGLEAAKPGAPAHGQPGARPDAERDAAAPPAAEPAAPPAAAPAAPPAAAPTGPAAVRPPRRPAIRVTTTSVILVIIGISLLVLGILAVRAMGDGPAANGSNTSPTKGSSPATTTPKSSPSSSPTSSPTADVEGPPEGFRTHRDPTGFSIAVPEGWSGPERKTGGVFFYSPDRSTYLQVDQKARAGSSALADWKSVASGGPDNFAGYKEIRVAPVTEGGPVTDPSGKKAADWEFTWRSGSGTKHVLDRGFVLNGHGYAILISAPEDEWGTTMRDLAPVYTSFEPAD